MILIKLKLGLFLVKKWEIQVIIAIIMLTRSSEIFFNPGRHTGYYNYDYAHSFFGKDF